MNQDPYTHIHIAVKVNEKGRITPWMKSGVVELFTIERRRIRSDRCARVINANNSPEKRSIERAHPGLYRHETNMLSLLALLLASSRPCNKLWGYRSPRWIIKHILCGSTKRRCVNRNNILENIKIFVV